MNGDQEVFKGKSFSDLLSDIYTNSKKKENQINGLIRDLQPMIKNIGDATVIVPLIAEYLDVSVKNDDHLVKMAAIVLRAMARTTQSEGRGAILTEEEKKQINKNEQIEKELTKEGKVLHELPICDRRKLGHKNVQEWFYCGGYDADENNLANLISKQMMKDLLETLNQEVN